MNSCALRRIAVLFAFATACIADAQQRPMQSPLVVTVTRSKTDSGRKTAYDSGYSSSKEYSRSVVLKSTTRNMATNDITVRQEAYFVSEAMSSGGQDGIYSRSETNLTVATRGVFEQTIESEPLTSQEYKSSYGSNYKYGSKFKGYIVRTFANGQLVDVQASQPSLQKAGWDDKLLKRMLPKSGAGRD